ncbi:hypothetical protein N0V93_005532 [Gnomoniopsis smithogilvyi]|uniref:Mitotic checkpoint regulator, MAD2B-interacting-domain-containing protein n=1 Tax=Gnomoniopsis smithogilvyi TaxID=1191159 RepID=A0A9W8YT17_9PEZI|nr:hypothetical protein N0V93_005532 [Gnomoniopsis smithogilvyi]
MGLVDYSDSESENDSLQNSAPVKAALPTNKKPFQKLVDKANPGKILVSLPSATADQVPDEEPAAKRIKTGGSKFSGFGSFLPPPKAVSKPALSGGKAAPKVGINLKTSSEAAFSRETAPSGSNNEENHGGMTEASGSGGIGLNLPPPKVTAPAQPFIPEDQKPADEVKMVGKPLMFKPLSVARKPGKKNGVKASAAPKSVTPSSTPAAASGSVPAATAQDSKEAPPPRKNISLFSIGEDETTFVAATEETTEYEPEFMAYDNSAYADAQQQYAEYSQPLQSSNADPNSLDSIADDLNLDPAARRELFGRGGGGTSKATAKSVINFNLDKEYQHNEELRASGALDQQKHNPLRAIKPGKHSLQQLVNQVQSQRDALEENFAKNRSTQKQAGSRYGWR